MQGKIKKIYLSILLIACISFLGSIYSSESSQQDKIQAPDFALSSADGKIIKLSNFKGKVVIIDFWATWCAPCRAEIPSFNKLYSRYKSKGLEIIGISLDDGGWDFIKPFVKEFKMNYHVVLGNEKVVEDYGEISAIPTTFVIDRAGNIYKRYVGYHDKATFENDIKTLLQ